MHSAASLLRIFYLDDKPADLFHIEAMIEDLGHGFVGSARRFADLVKDPDPLEVDGVLVDIDPCRCPYRSGCGDVASPAWHTQHLRDWPGSDCR
jgi:hypothetical protein